jgi:hypothetical protein
MLDMLSPLEALDKRFELVDKAKKKRDDATHKPCVVSFTRGACQRRANHVIFAQLCRPL